MLRENDGRGATGMGEVAGLPPGGRAADFRKFRNIDTAPDTAPRSDSRLQLRSIVAGVEVLAIVACVMGSGNAGEVNSDLSLPNRSNSLSSASEAVKVLENASESRNAKLEEAVAWLISDHSNVAPDLLRCFLEKSKRRHNRMLCAEILRQAAFPILPTQRAELLKEIRDAEADELIRITAASLLLVGQPQVGRDEARAIKDAMFALFRQSKFQDAITTSVFSQMPQDSQVEQVLLNFLRAEAHQVSRDGLLYSLGKRRCRALIAIIRDELDSEIPERTFTKPRMYLALGDIGGSEAAQLLIRQLSRERDWATKDLILWALGASKSAEGRHALLNQLKDQETGMHVAALFGLKFLGDRSTIPAIQDYLSKGNVSDYRRRVAEAAIEGISQGNANPSW